MGKKQEHPDIIGPVRAIWQKMFDDFAARPDGVHHSEAVARYRVCAQESIQVLKKPIDLSAMPKFAECLKELQSQLQLLVSSIDESPKVILGGQPREAVFCHGVEVGMAVANVWALIRFASNRERRARHSARAPNTRKWNDEVAAKAWEIFKVITRGKVTRTISVDQVARRIRTELNRQHHIDVGISTVKRNIGPFFSRHG